MPSKAASEDEDSDEEVASAAKFRVLEDSSEDEGRRRGKSGRGPKGKSTKAANKPAAGTKAPRFNWSTGDGKKGHRYLKTRFFEWLNASDDGKEQIVKHAAGYVASNWSFPRHNAGDIEKVSGRDTGPSALD